MTGILIAASAVSILVGLFGLLYVLKNLAPDLLLLGAQALVGLMWVVILAASIVRALGIGAPHEAITYWGYLLTGLCMPIAGIYLGLLERSKWGSLAITVISITGVVLAMRLPQIWPEGF